MRNSVLRAPQSAICPGDKRGLTLGDCLQGGIDPPTTCNDLLDILGDGAVLEGSFVSGTPSGLPPQQAGSLGFSRWGSMRHASRLRQLI
jgi:hypothetical protein